jgi:hypothetical protein
MIKKKDKDVFNELIKQTRYTDLGELVKDIVLEIMIFATPILMFGITNWIIIEKIPKYKKIAINNPDLLVNILIPKILMLGLGIAIIWIPSAVMITYFIYKFRRN